MGEVVHGEEINEYFPSLIFFLNTYTCAQLFREFALQKQQLGGEVGLADTLDSDATRQLFRITHG